MSGMPAGSGGGRILSDTPPPGSGRGAIGGAWIHQGVRRQAMIMMTSPVATSEPFCTRIS